MSELRSGIRRLYILTALLLLAAIIVIIYATHQPDATGPAAPPAPNTDLFL